MVLSVNTVIEVRSTGNDNNGGGFVTGSSGTDYSQQNSAQYTFSDLASSNATSASPAVTSASHNFVAADVGNLIQITAGTNWLTGFYQIVSVASNAATLDRACGNLASVSSGTYAVGGALATPTKALLNFVGGSGSTGGMTIYVKAATYQLSAAMVTGTNLDGGYGVTRFIGYSSSRGDGGQATIQSSANSIELMTLSNTEYNNLYSFENIIWDGNNKTANTGISTSNLININLMFSNCIFKNFVGLYVIRCSDNTALRAIFYGCDFTDNNFASNNSYVYDDAGQSGFVQFYNCYFANNSASGSNVGACLSQALTGTAQNCIFYNNTGTAFNPVLFLYPSNMTFNIINCIFHSNGSDAIKYSGSNPIFNSLIENNIFTSNGGYGINMSGCFSTAPTLLGVRNNAYYNNSSGAITGFTDGGGNQTLTGLPYNNVPTDFGLNNISGEGESCRSTGVPGTIGSASVVGTGYLDIGALQHQCVTGSGGMISEWFGV